MRCYIKKILEKTLKNTAKNSLKKKKQQLVITEHHIWPENEQTGRCLWVLIKHEGNIQ